MKNESTTYITNSDAGFTVWITSDSGDLEYITCRTLAGATTIAKNIFNHIQQGYVWVRPHLRNGHAVRGHWRYVASRQIKKAA